VTPYTQKLISLGKAYPRMSVTNLGVLLVLYDLGRATANELAKITNSKPVIVRDQLARFEERGLTEITSTEGKRAHLLTCDARAIIKGVLQ